MGAFDWAQSLANELITQYGQTVTYRQITNSVADPVNDPLSRDQVTTDYQPFAIFLSDKRHRKEFQRYVLNEEVHEGTERVLMPNQNFTPNIKDVIIRDGVEYQIRAVTRVNPNGQQILWQLEVSI